MRPRKSAFLNALLIFLGVLSVTGTAEAATVACGQVITQNTVLDADVGPCPGDGIVIGAGGITLDLGGHTVFGGPSSGAGVLITLRDGGATIRNGTITGFEMGVHLSASSGNTVERVLAQGNCTGLRMHGFGGAGPLASNNVIRGNLFRGNRCSGILLFAGATTNTMQGNDLAANAGPGVSMVATGPNNAPRNNRFVQNLIRDNQADGIHMLGVALGNSITGNVIRANAGSGIRLAGPPQVAAGPFLNTVEQNQIRDNGVDGVLAGSGTFSNRIIANVALGNRRYDLAEETLSGCPNTWTANTFVTRNRDCIS